MAFEAMQQSNKIDIDLMAAIGDISGALKEVRRLSSTLQRDVKKAGGMYTPEQAGQISYYKQQENKLLAAVNAHEKKRDREIYLRQKVEQERKDRRQAEINERRYYQHDNFLQKLRNFTGHATQKGYIQYAASLARGNISGSDIERFGDFLQDMKRTTLKYFGRSTAKTVSGLGKSISRIGMGVSGLGAFPVAVEGFAVEAMQEGAARDIEISEINKKLSEDMLRQTRIGAVSVGEMASINRHAQAAGREMYEAKVAGQIGGRYREWVSRIFGTTAAELSGKKSEMHARRLDEFVKQTGINIKSLDAEMSGQAFSKMMAVKFPELRWAFSSDEARLFWDRMRSGAAEMATGGGYSAAYIKETIEEFQDRYMKGVMTKRGELQDDLQTRPERKLEIAQQRLYNNAVADMQVSAWCQPNAY